MSNVKSGSFHIGGKNDGVTLDAQLLVVASDVMGFGIYKDSVHKLSFGVQFSGKVHAIGIGEAHQLFALAGRPIANLPGASNIPTLHITLNGIWGVAGEAKYFVWTDSPALESRSDLVNVAWADE